MALAKTRTAVRLFQNLFQLNTEPLYVQPDNPALVPINEPGVATNEHQKKKRNIFSTVFQALANSRTDAVVKVNTGLYNQNNEMTENGVRLQSNEPTSNVVLISEQRPSLIIDLPNKEDKVCLQGLKFAHMCIHSKSFIRWPGIKTVRDNRYRPMKVDDNINTSILVKRGTLQIDQCRFSLVTQKDQRHLYASIIVEQQGSLIITRSQLVGNVGTVGIYCKGGKVNIRECSFKEHGGMGVWMNGGPEASLILKNSTMNGCGQGLVLNGPFSNSVQNNVISNCSGSGVITLFGNTSNLINNEINQCKIGVEVENSSPKIMKNTLIRNKEYGLCSWSRMNGQCWPLVRLNIISENGKGGLLVWGSRNRSQVCNNVLKLNQRVGIKVQSNSHPHIFLNEVSQTFGNGVFIGGGATAFLQKNQISGSTNCNLILQGPNNIDNYIYNNHIHGARGQGIFLLHCQKFLIAKNNIHNNYNGIICSTSVVDIEENTITNNKCNGVMLVEDCHILMNENMIEHNKNSGLVCRNSSKAKLKANHFEKNNIEVVVQNGWEGIQDIEEENQFEQNADVRVPNNVECQLI